MQRTIRIQLEPSPYQADALAETSRQFTSAFNQTARLGWEADVYNAIKLHYLAYYAVKEAHPTLVSDLINQARVKAAEALRSAFALRKQGREVCMPQSSTCPPRYNVHTYRVDWESQTVRMSLVGGRQTIRLRVPHYAAKYAGYPTDTADLIEKEGYMVAACGRDRSRSPCRADRTGRRHRPGHQPTSRRVQQSFCGSTALEGD